MGRMYYAFWVTFVLARTPCLFSQNECYLTESPPRAKGIAISFCESMSPNENCCVPAFDEEMREEFNLLTGTSDLCVSTVTESKLALHFWFCFGCSDQQPKALEHKGTVNDDDGGPYEQYEIHVCSDFAKLLYPENFDDCGLIIPGERGNICSDDDTVMPSTYWGKGKDGAENFLNDDVGGKPPLFTDGDTEKFKVVIDDSEGCYRSGGSMLCMSWGVIILSLLLVISVDIVVV
mmetsp:Transcript_2313/g.3555  ORF Transcript_2313/g.3555 Transcript_2313/m.3555 type:complete len:234 (-) Transcript_2313:122-823(-)|eukprot:CAMPEP_0185034610 /NCGR_PEP_ID=MMETSP1103-20130426/24666_1 /TAXON_ID=36769 /ORGANISM="Paraphysomonas bandaiensis, Strain Caron Lab Isolate" /LENGTH=233 /DNA_ID=CAMNT_0027571343 /DNA_START=1 /DNA_END=702 /DNA_ORIENTATION=-